MRKLAGAAMVAVAVVALGGCEASADPQELIAKARKHREGNEHRAAVIELKNALVKDPDNGEARLLLGTTHAQLGDYLSAEKELRKALELHHDVPRTRAALGRVLLRIGEFEKVLEEVRLDYDAGNVIEAEVHTVRAHALMAMGRLAEADELLARALARQPDFPDALLGKARLAANAGKLDDAVHLVGQALAGAPKSEDAWRLKGDLQRSLSDFTSARAAYEKVIELNREDVPARLSMAALAIDSGAFDEARKWLAEARKIAPGNPIPMFMQALSDYRERKYEPAREAVQQALRHAPEHLPSMLLAGAIEYALGSHAQAQSYLSTVLHRAPGHLHARKLYVASLARSGQVQRALEVLEPALKQRPDAGVLALAGDVHLQANDFTAAARYFDLAAQQDPGNAGLRTRLGLSRYALGDAQRALAELESAVQLDSGGYHAHLALISTYLRQARYDEALQAAQRLEEKQPGNPLAHNLKGAIYLAKRDSPAARKQLEHALALQPSYLPAMLNLAQVDLAENDPRTARSRLEAILRKDPANMQALLALAALAPQLGATPKERIAWLERALQASPGSTRPRLLLARAYASAGDTPRALDVAQQALALHPDSPEALETLGAMQTLAGHKEQAAATYARLAALKPDSAAALHRLAVAQAESGNAEAARTTLRKALGQSPDFAPAYALLAQLDMKAGRASDALRSAGELQRRQPDSPAGYMLQGDVLMAQKAFARAAQSYEAAYHRGRSGVLAVKLHTAYSRAGNGKEADARLSEWLKASPEDQLARTYAAEVGLATGRFEKAAEHYEWLRARNPDNVQVLNNLAWTYLQLKDARALETAERAHRLMPENPAVADTLGWILVQQGTIQRGLALLKKAIDAAPDVPAIRYHYAYAAYRAGDRARAISELERLAASGAKFAQEADAKALLEQLRRR